MLFLNSERRFNDNSYLIDDMIFRLPGQLSIYVIENNGLRMMIDAGVELSARKIIKKLKNFDLFPIHKILLTHSHFDHVQAVGKLKKLMKGIDVEVLASEKAISNLKNPEKMNQYFGYNVDPISNVTPLHEGDIIDLKGLQLEIFNFFGHTQDSIAVFDKKNRNIFVGDAIIDKLDHDTMMPEFVPPDFNESQYLKTLEKLGNMKDDLNSISFAHFGVWKDIDFKKFIDKVREFHFDVKNSIIQWYNETHSLEYITSMYHDKFIPNSAIFTKENIHGLEFEIEWFINGLKFMGEIS
ncbi:MAG: MBL fold metallo-hydrolase [Promethearchaeota archaeon]|nr:MAG: MBL fold metallo-hydrolase [Candidatus Lokiarchaeota archaeon]